MVKLSFVRQRHVAASLLMAGTFLVSACGGGGGAPSTPAATPTPISTATAVPAATPTPTPVPANDAAFVCPSSDTPVSVARRASPAQARMMPRHYASTSAALTRTVAVSYDRHAVATQMAAIATRERVLGASLVRSDQQTNGTTTRVLSVPASRATALVASLRTSAGVRSVALRGDRRYPMTVDASYYTNDPYFTGFSNLAPNATSTPFPSTFEVPPYDESAAVPGQWGDHAIQLEHAFEYSQSNNGSSVGSTAALGSSSIKIAIIDTGEDVNHPELASKIVYQRCYITNPTSLVQSTSNFTLDPNGHGTDVSGIAAAATNNGFGFVGSGGNASIYAYRVDPTPDKACLNDSNSNNVPAECGADTEDIASAIEDAIANHVNIISMSLGQSGGKCVNGVDPDSYEDAAVKDAIANNIIVVAASGNDYAQNVTPPACDAGVIAAGATALADGQMNGTGGASGSAANPIEYVASYSNYGTPGASFRNASAWGIVAPGGDPGTADTSGNTTDELHWIENIYTTTPVTSDFAGDSGTDASGATGDVRILIAGTSMSTPLVAGAAALILAVNSSYQSPKAMKQLLCSTADEINDAKEGCGRLNVYRAMATALNDPQLP